MYIRNVDAHVLYMYMIYIYILYIYICMHVGIDMCIMYQFMNRDCKGYNHE